MVNALLTLEGQHMSPPSLFLLACLIASASSLPLASRDRDFALRHTKGGKSAADAAAAGGAVTVEGVKGTI